jgi:hypothetical protein
VGAHRFDDIGNRKDARFEADFVATQSARGAAAVKTLVVLPHRIGNRPGKFDALENFVTLLGVGFDDGEFGGSEARRFGQDYRGYGKFSNVMHAAGDTQSGHLMLGQSEFGTNGCRQFAHPPLIDRKSVV